MPDFIPGLQLSGLFFEEAVRPILQTDFPDLSYTAALIGPGSEILEFDNEMSTDHDWGPRLMLFLSEDDANCCRDAIHDSLRRKLPPSFYGYSTSFSAPDLGTQLLETIESGPVNHRVEIITLHRFFMDYLNLDVTGEIEIEAWLTLPEQKLLTIVAGAVYHDEIGLQDVRDRLAYYPHDIWLYLLAAGWNRIGQEEPFVGRTGIVGDEIGSAILAARLVRDVMRLCFLMEKQYAPYPKWFGTAFSRLNCAETLLPILRSVLTAEIWPVREQYLCEAYEVIAGMHNALNITPPLPAAVSNFFDRPFRVIHGERFAGAIRAQIMHPVVRRIADQSLIGSIDQVSDSTDLLSDPRWRTRVLNLYTE